VTRDLGVAHSAVTLRGTRARKAVICKFKEISMKSGYVDFWKSERNFGFIKDDDGNTYFVHVSAFASGDRPRTGCIVTFEEGRTSKGAMALNVSIVRGGGK
jgi:CspA family cold shock protein